MQRNRSEVVGTSQRVYGLIRQAQSKYTLALVASLSLLSAVLVWLSAPLVLRLPFGVLAALFLPGYALSTALFPRADDLDGVERKALAFGLSLALIPATALALNYSPWGLRPTPMVLTLTGLTLLATGFAWHKRPIPRSERFAVIVGDNRRREIGRVTKTAFAILASTLLLSVTALTLTLSAPPTRLTEFFIVGPEGLAKDYPRSTRLGENNRITVGITNRERTATTYRVSVETEGQTLFSSGPIQVSVDETWQEPMNIPLLYSEKEREIAIKLFKDGGAEPYRLLYVRTDVLPEEGVR